MSFEFSLLGLSYYAITAKHPKKCLVLFQELTGDNSVNTEAALEYYSPLEDFLDEYIEEHNISAGWTFPGKE